MADYYVDVVNGSSGNSGADSDHPKQFISQATTTAGNRVFLKRGQTHPIATYKFFGSGSVLADYGTGNLPILQKTAGGDAWIYIQDATGVVFKNFAIDANGYAGALISIKPASTGSSGHLLQGLEIYGSTNHSGLYIEGALSYPVTNVTVKNCTFHNNSTHGVICTEEVRGCLFESCTSYANGFGAAAHGFSTYSAGASPHVSGVVFKNCTAYGNIQSVAGEGQGFQFDDNSTNCAFVGCLSYSNQGAGFAFNVGSGHKMIGCIAYANNGPGFVANSNTGAVIANNVLNGNCRSTSYTAEIVLQAASTGATINNNILCGSDSLSPKGIILDAGSASGSTAKTNCIYGFATAASGITPTGTITSSPAFEGGYRLSAGSPCVNAGTFTTQLSDYNGKEFKNPPSIGAIMPGSTASVSSRSVARRGISG